VSKLQRILVTGAAGFIGRHLSDWLVMQGATVAGIGNGELSRQARAEMRLSHWIAGGVEHKNLLELGDLTGAPDIVYHLAGGSLVGASLAQPRLDFQRTVDSTSILLEWMRLHAPHARLVAVSSAAVYGAGHLGPVKESDVGTPYSPYGFHKFMIEQECRAYAQGFGLQIAVVRLFSVYGAGLRKQVLWDLCNKLVAGSGHARLGGYGSEMRDWTDIRDVVRVLERCATLASAEMPVVNAGTGIGTSVREITDFVCAGWPKGASITFDGKPRLGNPECLIADATLFNRLGVEWTVPVDKGVRDYVNWFLRREEGP
jgi:UDP-glucose 4-epimerase